MSYTYDDYRKDLADDDYYQSIRERQEEAVWSLRGILEDIRDNGVEGYEEDLRRAWDAADGYDADLSEYEDEVSKYIEL